MPIKLLIIGDAGTGKTYYLLKKAAEFEDCLFISHTNAAVNELKKRDRNNDIDARTLHSLCLSLLRRKRKLKVMDEAARQLFCKKAGLEYNPDPYESSPAKEFFSLRSLYINLKRPPIDRFCNRYRIDYDEFTKNLSRYEEFKREKGLIDFEDMLEMAIEEGVTISTQTVIVDEAQDLSPLQWDAVETIFDADMIIAAGDDLQSIFSFQGAKPDLFLSFSNNVKVLRKNYRIPRNLWDFAGWMIREQLQRPRSEPVDKEKKGVINVTDPMTFQEAANYIAAYHSGLVVVRHNKYCLILEELLKRAGIRPRLVKRNGFNWNAINIDTVHAVKGMEHERVFVIDAVKHPSFPAEEDRIWYTALTRAKKELHVIPILGEMNWATEKLPRVTAEEAKPEPKPEPAVPQPLQPHLPHQHQHVHVPQPGNVPVVTVHLSPDATTLVPAKTAMLPPAEDLLDTTALITPFCKNDKISWNVSAADIDLRIPDVKVSYELPENKEKETGKGLVGKIKSLFRRK